MKPIKYVLLLATLVFTTSIQSLTQVASKGFPYSDIANSYAKDAITSLYNQNIMKGTSATLFSPKQSITRAQFMTTLIRLLDMEAVNSSIPAYSDVKKSAWYYGTVQASTDLGLTEGTGNGTFDPDQSVTRQEAATWIVRALQKTSSSAYPHTGYKDDTSISDWARPYVSIISQLGLMQGNQGAFHPKQPLTRQETAMIIDRLLQNDDFTDKLDQDYSPGIQLGWQYGQTDEEYKKSILQSNVNTLSPRWYFLDSYGALSNHTQPSLVKWANNNGKNVWAMFGNRSDQTITHQLLSSSERSAALIKEIKSGVVHHGLQGINLDFENVAPEDRANLTKFVKNLASELHSVNAVLSVDVSPNLNSDWTAAFDYAALGKIADYIVLMGYDEHWTGGAYPGSVASLTWVENGLDKLVADVPHSKIILALPFYNRDWVVNSKGLSASSEDISLSEQASRVANKKLTVKWDAALGQYTTTYWQSKTQHKIWLEESRSLSLKYKMALDHGIAGFAYWSIGGETTDVWTSLRNAAKYNAMGD
ncbi:spore germination protein YaaH [Fontibacillus solani]|uniref:Spore germination protein YaaH n=1 Tax=Fontibacillus solani TaxID=1572857 RepID=A0A7W3SWU8_9BACL|nr:S-layer homology domain-containing protein [Fontibacillus solani]MBA9087721.1 spore germination protein YaaH [Fontibacillus solani]